MELFTGQNIFKFADKFKTDQDCLSYLADIKWANGYICAKCKHTKFTIRKKNYARDCNRCHHIESPTANTLFHRVRFGLKNAFFIVFDMSTSSKGLSSSQMAKRLEISRTTSWTFMHKIRIAMKSTETQPLVNQVQVDEFVFGGKEDLKQGRSNNTKKKKVVAAVELTDTGKIKRVYFKKINDYSSSSLSAIFESHISKSAVIRTDQWKGYNPLKKEYNIEQVKSNKGQSMKQMHTIIHQVKSWLRSTYSWMHEGHIEKYFDEYSFRINRSQSKQTIFDTLIQRMMKSKNVCYQQIIISN
jgi:transposase-like protein